MSDDLLQDARVSLRADLVSARVDVVPGVPTLVDVEVQNPSDVIESIEVRLVMPDARTLAMTPSILSLFPGESGLVTVEIGFHDTLEAGTRTCLLEFAGRSGETAPAQVPVRLYVASTSLASVVAEPPVVTGRRRGRFQVAVANHGNTPIVTAVRAADADRVLDLRLTAASIEVLPGEVRHLELRAKGRRPWTGTPLEHLITIGIESDDVTDTAEVRFRQKPRLTAGLITALTLALIVALWAAAMLFGVTAALGPPELEKEIPGTFAAGEGVGIEDLDPAAVGGAVAGTVTAASTAQPVARVTVEAIDGRGRLAGATTTDEEGVFELTSLLPTRYLIRFRAPGFDERWFPDSPTPEAGTLVSVIPDEVVEDINGVVQGLPGSLGGQVITGDGPGQPITVQLAPLDVVGDTTVRTAVTDAGGLWSVGALPAPATYRITYAATGYAPVDVTEPLVAGATQIVNTVRLPAAPGSLSGVVVDRDGQPIGGVEIEASSGEEVLTTTTPTSGAVGTFSLLDLPTPATYLLTFRAPGAAEETQAVRLGPGEERADVEIVLNPTSGVASGTVRGSDGQPLGGVDVTLSGGGTTLTTQTLTSGDIGGYRLGDVPVPGVYALTFDLDGFVRQTVQIELDAEEPAATTDIALVASRGTLTGVVVDSESGAPLDAVTITVSDGNASTLTTTASGPGDERGRFVVGDLAPGTYTITASIEDGDSRTLLREVRAGETTAVSIAIDASR